MNRDKTTRPNLSHVVGSGASKRPTTSCALTVLAAVCFLALACSWTGLAWAQDDAELHAMVLRGDLKPTRWRHPLDAAKPLHALPLPEAPFSAVARPPFRAPGLLPTPPGLGTGRVCIAVESAIAASLTASFTQYQADLVAEGFSPFILEVSGGTPADLRASLIAYFAEPQSLVGVVLVGDLPYIIYEVMQDWDGTGGDPPEYEDFPCDLFFMDLDGTWQDVLTDGSVQPGNGKYDTWTGDRGLEVWCCRLRTSNLSQLGGETALLNDYFSRNHTYRTSGLFSPASALVYDDDDWDYMGSDDADDAAMAVGAGNVTTVSAPESTTASNYMSPHLAADYRLTKIRSHGYPGGHGFYENAAANFNWVLNANYRSIDPSIEFHSLFVCSGCDYTYGSDYLAGTIAFNPEGNGLVAWGSTKTGGFLWQTPFYTEISLGGCIGDAFIQWFNTVGNYSYAPRWFYGTVLIGDASLQLCDVTAPTVSSITPTTPNPTNNATVSFSVNFSEDVQHFASEADLTITETGTVAHTGASISGGPRNYTVDVTGVSGDGTLALAANTGSDIQDLATNALASSVTSSEVIIDTTGPTADSITPIE